MQLSARWLLPTSFLCLLLSGIAGLVYQVVWTRYLALLLGHTSYAVVAVLVAFMGGLAVGNAWLGRYADRVRRPLALYGWMEIGITVYALVFPLYFELCQQAYEALGRGAKPGSASLLGLKFLVSLAAILVPTVLMGGTLPVLTRLVTRSLGELRERVAGLYFINSLGAVFGVALAEFVWIPAHGLDVTVLLGALLNGIVGAVALLVSAGLREGSGSTAEAERSGSAVSPAGGDAGPVETYTPWELRLVLAAACLSGFVAMLYEIVWTRLLALVLGSSTHAFAIMLVTFIAGIACGAWIVARWRTLRRTLDAFGWAELALAGTLLVSMFFYHLLPLAFVKLGSMLVRHPNHHGIYQAAQLLVCFGVMFVPAICLGMTLPLASRVATAELARTGRSVGLVFSLNTVGTVAGAALTGLVLLPVMGLARAFALGIGLNLVIALAVLGRHRAGVRSMVFLWAPLAVAAVIGVAHVWLDAEWTRAFSLGLWRMPNPPLTLAAYRAAIDDLEPAYHKDGAGSTVLVQTWTNRVNGDREYTLRVNGKADASTVGDLPTQLLTGHIPMLLHSNATEVMVVGIGSGMTGGAVLRHPGVRRVDSVEISPEVVETAGTLFSRANRGALQDPRSEVIIDDAKSFLRTSGRRYDIIISEPSNPWMAGVSGVFSLEYYETCRASLRPGGLMAQWVQIYETDDETLRTVLATFTSVFPFASVWQTLPGDLMLVGSVAPLRVDLAAMQRRFDEPAVLEDLRRADVFRLSVLLGLQLVSESNTAFIPPPETPRHSDYLPVLEYRAERAFFVRSDARIHQLFNESAMTRPGTLLGVYLRQHPLTELDAQAFALFYQSYRLPHPWVLRSLIERWRDLAPGAVLPAEFSAKLDYPLPVAEVEASRMRRVLPAMLTNAVADPDPLRMYSRHLMNGYRQLRSAFHRPPTEELVTVLERLVEADPVHRQSHQLRLAELAWDAGDDDRFFRLAADAFLRRDDRPMTGRFDLDYQAPARILFLIIETLWRGGRYQDAQLWCQAAVEGGYLNRGGGDFVSKLAMVIRKVEATVRPQGGGEGAEPGPGR